MAYTPNTPWVDGSGGGTPITAARLNNMEAGLVEAGASVERVMANRSSTFQSINDSTLTAMIWNNADSYDTDAMHDPAGANPSRITIATAGVYVCGANVSWAAHATGWRGIGLRVNAGTTYGWTVVPSIGATTMMSATSWRLPLNATDYVEVVVYQTSGGALNAGSNDSLPGANTVFQADRIGGL